MKLNKNIRLGKKDLLPPGGIKREDVKVRISIILDGDLLDFYRKQAKTQGIGYQVLIQKVLREQMQIPSLQDQFSDLKSEVRSALKRLEKT
jgi:hypothetical protein